LQGYLRQQQFAISYQWTYWMVPIYHYRLNLEFGELAFLHS